MNIIIGRAYVLKGNTKEFARVIRVGLGGEKFNRYVSYRKIRYDKTINSEYKIWQTTVCDFEGVVDRDKFLLN